MTLTNRNVLVNDPTLSDIPNLGVAKVENPTDEKGWQTLAWELRSFVCEGEYERGLARILDQFLAHLSQAQQPAVWVSGFYGSGKSHLMRVLEYLWLDSRLPNGSSARELTHLTADIKESLAELSTAAKRGGGLWSAAGTLGSGSAGSVRLAFLEVVFSAAGLPRQYGPARLILWMKQRGIYDAVRQTLEVGGNDPDFEFRNLYVSDALSKALIAHGVQFGDTPAAVSERLQAQFGESDDISNDEMLQSFEDVLREQTGGGDDLPLTLVVLDELQLYIGQDNQRAEHVQGLVEACSSRFGSRVLIVATGQSALTAEPMLQKLLDRFTVTVALSDTDVETVVRQVLLRKKPEHVAELEEALDASAGEIGRQLGGTQIEAKGEDATTMVADYPLLPTRRRFWERVLRSIDTAGKSGVLRTQLKIVHAAVSSVVDRPLGTVIPGDFIFHSESASMLQSGVLLKEIDELIRTLDDGSPDGILKSRAAALVFLISRLPQTGIGDTGLRATASTVADLLVEDLSTDGAAMRRDVPRVLEQMVDDARLVKIGDAFYLQTADGAEWNQEFNQRRVAIRSDATRMASLRSEWLLETADTALQGLQLTQGAASVARKLRRHWGDAPPAEDGGEIPVWLQDEWSTTETQFRNAAGAAGLESPTIFVLFRKSDADAVADTLASLAAARETIGHRPEPQTAEGRQAKEALESRAREHEQHLEQLASGVVSAAMVLQGGGNEVSEETLRGSLKEAGMRSLDRLFPRFKSADVVGWDKVIYQVRQGAPDALAEVGWSGDVPSHPVCEEILDRTAASGTAGEALYLALNNSPYGWPKDAVDGGLLALIASGHIRAAQDNGPVRDARSLPPTQIRKATFFKENEPPSMTEQLEVRGVLSAAKVNFENGEEGAAIGDALAKLRALAAEAGGQPPLPEAPSVEHINELSVLAGNEQMRAVAQASEHLRQDSAEWQRLAAERKVKEQAWNRLDRLLGHAVALPLHEEVKAARDAVLAERLLLATPDPVPPIVDSLREALREAVLSAVESINSDVAAALKNLEDDPSWGGLSEMERVGLLADARLGEMSIPAVETENELLASLDQTSLTSWAERRQAIPAKVMEVRRALVQRTAPASVEVKPPSATMRDEDQVEAYITGLRATLLGHIANGETVVI